MREATIDDVLYNYSIRITPDLGHGYVSLVARKKALITHLPRKVHQYDTRYFFVKGIAGVPAKFGVVGNYYHPSFFFSIYFFFIQNLLGLCMHAIAAAPPAQRPVVDLAAYRTRMFSLARVERQCDLLLTEET